MFGHEYEFVKEYPNYFLDYQEQVDENNRWTDRIVSSSGDWSGNLYVFYFRVYNKIVQDVKVPFKLEGGERAGSGIPNIFTVWNKQGWPAPKIEESFELERITLSLQIEVSGDKKVAITIRKPC